MPRWSGFHGYKENAAIQMDVLRRIAGDRPIGLISIQGLHRFYSRGGDVVASWMTKEDREHAIADNVDYVGTVLTAVADEFGITRPLIYVGFSQGVAMAFRTAALVQRPCDGLIVLASDVPPDVAPLAASLPKNIAWPRRRGRVLSGGPSGEGSRGAPRRRRAASTEHVFEGGHAVDAGIYCRTARHLSMNSSAA